MEFSMDYEPIKNFSLYGDYTYTDAKYVKGYVGRDGTDYSGNRLCYVPKHIINLRTGYMPNSGLGGWLEYHIVSDIFANDTNTIKMDGYAILNGQLSYRWDKYCLAVDVVNMTDREYSQRKCLFGGNTSYAVSEPLSAYVTFRVTF